MYKAFFLMLMLCISFSIWAIDASEASKDKKTVYILQGLQQASNAQAAMSTFYIQNHYWPETHKEAGLPEAKHFATQAINHIGIARTGPTDVDMGVIIIQFNEKVDHSLLILEGKADENGIQWICKGSLDKKYLPMHCQEDILDTPETETIAIKKPVIQESIEAKQNYVKESIRLSRGVRRALLEYYYTYNKWPKDNIAAGLTLPEKIKYGAVNSITVSRTGSYYDDQGIITMQYGDILGHYTLILESRLLSDGSIRWSCRGGNLPIEFRPKICHPK